MAEGWRPTAGLVADVLRGVFGFMPDDPSAEYSYYVRMDGDGHLANVTYLPFDESTELSFEELNGIAGSAGLDVRDLLRALLDVG